jgi:coenzyme PQQ precursor peptide PqqA
LSGRTSLRLAGEDKPMAWKTPRMVEICLGLEINSYASAEIG